jgi:hypothetical protein
MWITIERCDTGDMRITAPSKTELRPVLTQEACPTGARTCVRNRQAPKLANSRCKKLIEHEHTLTSNIPRFEKGGNWSGPIRPHHNNLEGFAFAG